MAVSPWANIAEVPADPILGLVARFKADPAARKVNLAQGAYRTDEGKPFVLEAVRRAEERVVAAKGDKEYLPVEGFDAFCAASARFALGEESAALREDRVAAMQSISGTGALWAAAEFLRKVAGVGRLWVSRPTWGNHPKIFRNAGLECPTFGYIDAAGTGLDFASMVQDLRGATAGDAVLLHACAHNPTGVDPTPAQWRELADIFLEKGLVPLFDSAYQGYASGDPVADAASIRLFEALGVPGIICCQSYAKNMGLYGERVGAMLVICASTEEKRRVLSQLKQTVVRPVYSSPPLHGVRIATMVLSDEELRAAWYKELVEMSTRLRRMRQLLADELRRIEAPRTWTHIESQIGMFAYTGLSPKHVALLLERFNVYLTTDGRMSIAGLMPSDVEYVAAAIKAVLVECPSSDL